MSERESAEERFARAHAKAQDFRARRRQGSAETLGQFLHANADLRDLLEPMLSEDDEKAVHTEPPDARDPEASDSVGVERFGHFRIIEALGSGGMADVYLAVDEKLNRNVALKLIRPEALWSRDAKQRFRREALAVGRLDHPGICKLYEAGEHDGWPFMALQLIDGETLATRLVTTRQAGRRPTSAAPKTRGEIFTAVTLVERVARALHYAHERGLVHRDIKPLNIMIGPDDRPVVLDFGLARDTRSLDQSLSSSRRGIGTPLYMAPEQIRPDGEAGVQTDIYALGVTLYECLTYERPFDAPTEAELFEKILANSYQNPRKHNPQLPPELELVIACALDRDPERRYRTALEMAEDLRRVRELQPVRARPIGPLMRMRRWVQRNPTLLAVSSLACVTMLASIFAARYAIDARANLDQFNLLADVVRLRETKAAERQLYPAYPAMAEKMRRWLDDEARPLARRLVAVREARDQMLARVPAREPAASRSSTQPAGLPEQFLLETLTALTADLESFTSDKGELRKVEARLHEAETIEQRSIDDHRREWDEAIAAIAAEPKYDGLRIEPQTGLVPLGADHESKLWEFAHIPSGEIAERAPDGKMSIKPKTGIVFVLLPGGSFRMGSSADDPGSQPNERPAREVTLASFLISKFEMTQGQWQRITGVNPSHLHDDTQFVKDGRLHPVEDVTWEQCMETMRQLGMVLPTEAQWEYAARGGTTHVFWHGDDLAPLSGIANIADSYARDHGGHPNWAYQTEVDDHWTAHAPAGTFSANPFGLHEILGNVAEWCIDEFHSYETEPLPANGERRGKPVNASRMLRGGAFSDDATYVRCARRFSKSPDWHDMAAGLRPVRLLE